MNEQTTLDQINETIKQTITSSKDRVKELVIDGFVTAEVNRRADLLAKLVTAINTLSKEGNKIKPDLVSFDQTGAVSRQEYSKNKIEEKRKFSEKLTKAQKAFENAVENGDYSNIENLVKELAVKSGGNKEESSENSDKS